MAGKNKPARSPWKPGTVAFCTPAGGLITLGAKPPTSLVWPYVAKDLIDKCIVYSGCPVWVNTRTRQVSTRNPDVVTNEGWLPTSE